MTALPADRPATRLANRLAFLAAGFCVACWAPLIPFAKARLAVNDAQLGLLLLCVGVGSLLAMPITGLLSARIGSRSMILLGGVGMGVLLPVLAVGATPVVMGGALLLFGASLGTLDVAMNAHAVEVEAVAPQPLMSGFHAMYSVGGFAGAGAMTLLLSLAVAPLPAAIASGALTLAAVAWAAPSLLSTRHAAADAPFAIPKGVVLLIAGLCAATFLVEGAMLDWGALLIAHRRLAPVTEGGLGYMLFSIAMTFGRFTGDAVIARLGPRRVLIGGALVAVAGFVALLATPGGPMALGGFLLIGLGAANLVPVLFSAAGRQRTMPPPMAIAAVTTTGYAGILAGPAMVGFVAQSIGLTAAFWLLAVLMCLPAIFARPATRAG